MSPRVRLRLFAGSLAFGASVVACAGVFTADPANSADDAGADTSPTPIVDAATAPIDAAIGAPVDAADASTVDAAPVPPRCSKTGDFGRPELVRELSTGANEFAATLAQNELTIYLARDGVILVASRARVADPFGAAQPLAGLGTLYEDDNPALTADDRTLFFSSKGRVSDRTQIFRAPIVAGGVGAVTVVQGLVPDVEDPAPIPDGGGLYYSATRSGPADDVFFATLASPTETLVAASDPTAGDGQPVLSADELSLFFGSRRSGLGGSDVFVSQRGSTSVPFTTATWLGGTLNSTATDLPVWVSRDGCVLYLTSDRAGGAGGRDLYRSTRGM